MLLVLVAELWASVPSPPERDDAMPHRFANGETLACTLLLPSVRAHNAKHRMMQRFPLKVGERGVRGHVKVGLDKRDAFVFSEVLFEDGCCFSRLKLDGSNGFGATPSREVRRTRGPQVAHPVHFSKGRDQKARAAVFHQGDRDGVDLSTRAPSHGEQG